MSDAANQVAVALRLGAEGRQMAPALRRANARLHRYEPLKLALEWQGALLLLATALPLLILLGFVVRLTSPGPALYSQMRLGRNGRPFRIHKLRTMTHGCERATGPVWSMADDPRVTRVGRWLRDTHLDELPQLWNVLRGEMGLIGPRPERPELVAKIELALPEFRGRLCVRPGITGLAQMRQPADSDLQTVQRKLAHDLHYIRNIGPMLDLRIALSTVLHFVALASSALSRQVLPPVGREAIPQHPAVTPVSHGLELAGVESSARASRTQLLAELSRAA